VDVATRDSSAGRASPCGRARLPSAVLCATHLARQGRAATEQRGSTLEIDHIVSLELGGSNDIANLYPEEATLPGNAPGFHVKDKLENKLHDLVCDGTMTLRSVQRQIAATWQALYKRAFGMDPRSCWAFWF
jgi:hypothetical protein